jgi:type IV pilus assembly protein PilW
MRPSQRGLTLVEMLVSITIGLIVISAVSYVYLGSKGAYRGNESLARIQESGRFALDSMMRDIRRAGALGCASVASIINQPVVPAVLVQSSNSATFDPTVLMLDSTTGQPIAIYGIAPSSYTLPATQPTTWLLPSSGSGPNVPKSAPAYWGGDILQLQIASGVPARMSSNVDAANKIVTIADNTAPNGGTNFAPGLALLADCSSAAIFQITNVSGATTPASLTYSTSNGPMPASFSVNTFPSVQHFDQITYYVGLVPNGNGQTALYRYSMSTGKVEAVVNNVEDLDIEYGIGKSGSMAAGTGFARAAALGATDWPNVIGVRVSLIAVGDQQGVAPAAQNLGPFHGGTTNWTAPDTRLRQVFSATAALRDRLQ